MRMNALDKVAYILVLIGGLNWGLVGFFKWNLVDEIFGKDSGLARIVYALVGLSALYLVLTLSKWMGKEKEA